MGKIILIRHGETDKNKDSLIHEADDLASLNQAGRHQISLTADKMASFSSVKIYSSKKLRTVESASLIAEKLHLPYERISGLEERNWGVYSNKPWADVKKMLDQMTLDERYRYLPEGGESWQAFEGRLVSVIKRIAQKHLRDTVIIVTHGGAIRALLPFLLAKPKEESFHYDPANASLTIFDYQNGRFKKIAINDITHLQN